jgi:hypothetical protein
MLAMKSADIIVPVVAEIVVDQLNDSSTNTLLVSASKAAEKAYRKVINNQYDDLQFRSWLPPGISNFGQLLKKTIRGECIVIPDKFREEDKTILSGCTDIELPFGEDSAKIYAKQLAEDAYQALDVI